MAHNQAELDELLLANPGPPTSFEKGADIHLADCKHSPGTQKRISAFTRLLPLCLASVSTLLVLLLLFEDSQKWNIAGGRWLTDIIQRERPATAVVVQIVSQFLGFFWTFSVALAFNLTVRQQLTGKSTTVARLRMYTALSHKHFDLTLPVWMTAVTITFFGIAFLPTWLWTGSLTPRISSVTQNYTVKISSFSKVSLPVNENIFDEGCQLLTTTQGSYSDCPAIFASAQLVGTLRMAAPSDPNQPDKPQNRSKIDNSAWSISGRSYGVGAAVGYQNELYDTDLYNYTFAEVGLMASVHCVYNKTSAFYISNDVAGDCQELAAVYSARGPRPNANWANLTANNQKADFSVVFTTGTSKPSTCVAFSAGGSGGTWDGRPPYQLSMAAGHEYGFLDKIQCSMDFDAHLFSVTADTRSRLITVQRLQNASMEDTQRRGIIERTLRSLQGITQVQTTLYTSTTGQALLENAVAQQLQTFNATQPSNDALSTIEYALESVLDDIMMSLSSYRYQNNQTDRVDGHAERPWVYIGSPKFHISLAVLNIVALLAILAVTIWTKAFLESPIFDFSDLVTMTVATHNGTNTDDQQVVWNGDPADPKLRDLSIDLKNRIGTASSPYVLIGAKKLRST